MHKTKEDVLINVTENYFIITFRKLHLIIPVNSTNAEEISNELEKKGEVSVDFLDSLFRASGTAWKGYANICVQHNIPGQT